MIDETQSKVPNFINLITSYTCKYEEIAFSVIKRLEQQANIWVLTQIEKEKIFMRSVGIIDCNMFIDDDAPEGFYDGNSTNRYLRNYYIQYVKLNKKLFYKGLI